MDNRNQLILEVPRQDRVNKVIEDAVLGFLGRRAHLNPFQSKFFEYSHIGVPACILIILRLRIQRF